MLNDDEGWSYPCLLLSLKLQEWGLELASVRVASRISNYFRRWCAFLIFRVQIAVTACGGSGVVGG
jgi:hypothetical protein